VKILITFSVFLVLHIFGWLAVHAWMKSNPKEIVVVADTSFSMKSHFDEMEKWLSDYVQSSRYSKVVVGTDKEILGEYNSLRSTDVVFRSAFGKFTRESLTRYDTIESDKRILLSDGTVRPKGWQIVEFN